MAKQHPEHTKKIDGGNFEARFRLEEDAFQCARDFDGVSIREDWQAPGYPSEYKSLTWVARWGPGITPTVVAPIATEKTDATIAFLTGQLAAVMAKLNALEAKASVPGPIGKATKGGTE